MMLLIYIFFDLFLKFFEKILTMENVSNKYMQYVSHWHVKNSISSHFLPQKLGIEDKIYFEIHIKYLKRRLGFSASFCKENKH